MNCKNCNRPNRETARFCKWCGSALELATNNILPEIIGHNHVKDKLAEIIALQQVLVKRARASGVKSHFNNDTIIIGPTGTGKKTLVNAIAKLFAANGIIRQAQPLIVDAVEYRSFCDDLVKNLQAVEGGILCIYDVHKLVSAKDANNVSDLDVILNAKKSMNLDFILILAGCPSDFKEYLDANMNVKNQFANYFQLEDYGLGDHLRITEQMLRSAWGLNVTQDALSKLERVLKKKLRDGDDEIRANGHYLERLTQQIAQNVYKRDDQKVEPDDIVGEEYVQKTTEEVMASLDKYVGIDEIREKIQDLVNSIKIERENGQEYELQDHYLFLGNPGTGKTTIARIFADIFCSLELLPMGHIVEVSRAELVSQWVGETPKEVKRYVQKAMGGILFVDEAYTLIKDEHDDVGKEAVNTLLKLMEDERGKFVCIAAGYTDDMQTHYTLSDDAEEHLSIFFKMMYNMRQKDFANARSVRNVYEEAKKRHNSRIQQERAEGKDVTSEITVLSRQDIEGEDANRQQTLDEVLEELDALIGMNSVKETVRKMARRVEMDKIRMERGLIDPKNAANHIVLTGNPGTGKTTVAMMLGKIFKAIGLLPTDKVVEKEAKNLKSSYMNDTGKEVDKACDEAMGGVLFIDEAYMLMKIDDGGNNDQTGEEAVGALMTRMVKDAGKFIVVMAGYRKEMDEFIDRANPGFRRRFKTFIHIEDYSASELVEIFKMQVKRSRMKITEQAEKLLTKMVTEMVNAKSENFGNAGEMTNLLEKVKDLQSERLNEEAMEDVEHTDEQLVTIEACDIPYSCPEPPDPDEVLAKLDDLIGLQSVKQEIRELANTLNANILRAQRQGVEAKIQLDHYLFLGNPGTGKTTVAQMMADIFYALGMLPTNKLVEVTRKDLVMGFSGQTAKNVGRVVKSAIGGVLFIDEAYSLKNSEHDDFGQEAIDTLLPMLLTYKNKFICIAAGYTREMKHWLATNSGLTSRFTETIEFPDYQPDELADIFLMKAHKEKFVLEPQAEQIMRQYLTDIFNRRDSNFGNARVVGNYFNKVKKRQSTRIAHMDVLAADFDDAQLSLLTVDDMQVDD